MGEAGTATPAGGPRRGTSARPVRAAEYWLTLGLGLALYAASMAPGVLWQDSGLAQIRVLKHDIHGALGLALAHPLYYVLAIGFQVLPFAESAFKTNLVSVVFGALTVANVYVLLRLLTGKRLGAVIGTISVALAHTFWQHCALAEVYSVTTALLTLELICLLQFQRTGRTRWLGGLFLANGLGVTNHMVAVLSLACYAGWLVWSTLRRRTPARVLLVAAAWWLCGAALYLGMMIAEVCKGIPLGAVVHSALFGDDYTRNVLNAIPSPRMIVNTVLILGLNFPTPNGLLLIPGLAALLSRNGRKPELHAEWSRPFAATLLALVAVHGYWAVRYDVPDQYTFFIPTVVLLAIVIGLGADRFLAGRGRGWRIAALAGTLLPIAVYFLLPPIARKFDLPIPVGRDLPYRDALDYFLRPWKTGYRGPVRFARELRDELPPGAVLMLEGDTTAARPVHYLQLTGRWNPQIRVCPPAAHPDVRTTADELRSDVAAGNLFVVTANPLYWPAWLHSHEVVPWNKVFRVLPRAERPASRAADDNP